jgi:hypothetical protein
VLSDSKNHGQIPDAQPELFQVGPLVKEPQAANRGLARIAIRFTSFRVHLLDPDNLAAGCKDLLDGLRHAGLIPDDTSKDITFQADQEKVRRYVDEKTDIEIHYPEGREPSVTKDAATGNDRITF